MNGKRCRRIDGIFSRFGARRTCALSVFLASSKTQFLFNLFDAAPQPIWLDFLVSLVFLVLFQVSFVVFSSPMRIVHAPDPHFPQ